MGIGGPQPCRAPATPPRKALHHCSSFKGTTMRQDPPGDVVSLPCHRATAARALLTGTRSGLGASAGSAEEAPGTRAHPTAGSQGRGRRGTCMPAGFRAAAGSGEARPHISPPLGGPRLPNVLSARNPGAVYFSWGLRHSQLDPGAVSLTVAGYITCPCSLPTCTSVRLICVTLSLTIRQHTARCMICLH